MIRSTEVEHKIAIVASAAQVLRDAHPSHQLAKIECGVASILSYIESDLISHRLIFEANDVRDLREGLLGVWVPDAVPVATANALLLLMDVCALLTFDECQTQQALSLADWCEGVRLLDTPIESIPLPLLTPISKSLPSPLPM
jgi:hypothetical protein